MIQEADVPSVTAPFAFLPAVRIPLDLHLCQHLVWSIFLTLAICLGVTSFVVLTYISLMNNGLRMFSWAYWPFSYPLL